MSCWKLYVTGYPSRSFKINFGSSRWCFRFHYIWTVNGKNDKAATGRSPFENWRWL